MSRAFEQPLFHSSRLASRNSTMALTLFMMPSNPNLDLPMHSPELAIIVSFLIGTVRLE